MALGATIIAVSVAPAAFGLVGRAGVPFGGGFFGVFLLLWGTLLLARGALVASRSRRYGAPGGRWDPALAAARQRYARGEITREQFHEIVQELRRPPGPLP